MRAPIAGLFCSTGTSSTTGNLPLLIGILVGIAIFAIAGNLLWRQLDSRSEACGASVSGLDGTFFRVNVTIDYLKVWQAPIVEQIRPGRFPMFAPHPKQWDAVVNFGVLPQPSAALAAAPRLQPPQEPGVVTRRVPKLPRDHTGAVPVRIHVSAAIPQIDMPTETIDRSAAHA